MMESSLFLTSLLNISLLVPFFPSLITYEEEEEEEELVILVMARPVEGM